MSEQSNEKWVRALVVSLGLDPESPPSPSRFLSALSKPEVISAIVAKTREMVEAQDALGRPLTQDELAEAANVLRLFALEIAGLAPFVIDSPA